MELSPEDSARGGPPERVAAMPVSEVADLLRRDPVRALDALASHLPTVNKAMSSRRQRRFGTKGSLSVEIAGPKRGQWFDHETGEGGDVLSLALRYLGHAAGLQWAREIVGEVVGANLAHRPPSISPPSQAPKGAGDAGAKRRENARTIWQAGQPLAGSRAADYLAARVPGAAGLLDRIRPDALRSAPKLRHSNAGKDFPAMLGAVTDGPGGEPLAVHRTYLDWGEPGKAPVDPAKSLLGSPDGGGVWFTDERPRMVIGEGIETTLSAMAALGPECGAVAALSTAGLANLHLPPGVREVILLVDVDNPDAKKAERPGEAAARKAAARWEAEGRTVRLAYPGPGDGEPCDFNDLWRRSGRDAVLAAIEGAEAFVSDASRALRDGLGEMVADVTAKLPLPGNVWVPTIPTRDIRDAPSRAEVEARLRDAAQSWVDQAVRWHAWRGLRARAREAAMRDMRRDRPDLVGADRLPTGDPAREARGAFVRERSKHYRRTWAVALKASGWPKDARPPSSAVLRATPGLGKTHAVIVALAEAIKAAPVPVLVPWLVPDYALADEAVKRFKAAGVAAIVLKGRGQRSATGEALCVRTELAEQVAKAGLPVRQTVCERPGQEPCPRRHDCGYFQQWAEAPALGVIVATHHALAHGRLPAGEGDASRLGPVVVDESPFSALEREARDRPLVEVGRVGGWLRDLTETEIKDADKREAAIEAAPVVDAVARVLTEPNCAGRRWRDVLGFAAADLLAAAAAIRGTFAALAVSPRDEGSIIWAVCRAGDEAERRRVADLLDAIAHDLAKKRPALQSVTAWTPPEGGEASRMYRVVPATVRVRPDTPALILDGSADRDTYAAALGVTEFIEATIEPALCVTHITQPSFSHRALGLPQGGATEDANAARWAAGEARRAVALEAVRLVVRLHGRGKVLVVLPKALRVAWTGEPDPKGISPWEEEGVLVGHFGALRGQDAARDCIAVVVVGRPLPPRRAAEDMARRRFAHDDAPLRGLIQEDRDKSDDPDADWSRDDPARRGWHENFGRGWHPLRMCDGSERELSAPRHIDPRVQACVRQVATDEIEQAAHRIRPAQAEAGAMKEAYILSDTPHDLTVDRVVTLDEWRRLAEVRLVMGGGPLSLDRSTVGARAPSVFRARDGGHLAERQQRRTLEGLKEHIISNMELLRRARGGRSCAIDNSSIWPVTAPPQVAGVLLSGEQSPRLVVSDEELPTALAAVSAILFTDIQARECLMEVVNEDAVTDQKAAFAELAAASDDLRRANSNEARLAAFERKEAAAGRLVQRLTVDEVREIARICSGPWSDEARGTNCYRLGILLGKLDPFVQGHGGLLDRLPDGRRLADLGSEAEAIDRLLVQFIERGEPVPDDLRARPYMQWLIRKYGLDGRAAAE